MHFTELIDLVAERLGGAVLAASDEFFAPTERNFKSTLRMFHSSESANLRIWWASASF